MQTHLGREGLLGTGEGADAGLADPCDLVPCDRVFSCVCGGGGQRGCTMKVRADLGQGPSGWEVGGGTATGVHVARQHHRTSKLTQAGAHTRTQAHTQWRVGTTALRGEGGGGHETARTQRTPPTASVTVVSPSRVLMAVPSHRHSHAVSSRWATPSCRGASAENSWGGNW